MTVIWYIIYSLLTLMNYIKQSFNHDSSMVRQWQVNGRTITPSISSQSDYIYHIRDLQIRISDFFSKCWISDFFYEILGLAYLTYNNFPWSISFTVQTTEDPLFFQGAFKLFKEYVSLLIGLYKDNGSVSRVAIYFFFIWPVYLTRTQLVLGLYHALLYQIMKPCA